MTNAHQMRGPGRSGSKRGRQGRSQTPKPKPPVKPPLTPVDNSKGSKSIAKGSKSKLFELSKPSSESNRLSTPPPPPPKDQKEHTGSITRSGRHSRRRSRSPSHRSPSPRPRRTPPRRSSPPVSDRRTGASSAEMLKWLQMSQDQSNKQLAAFKLAMDQRMEQLVQVLAPPGPPAAPAAAAAAATPALLPTPPPPAPTPMDLDHFSQQPQQQQHQQLLQLLRQQLGSGLQPQLQLPQPPLPPLPQPHVNWPCAMYQQGVNTALQSLHQLQGMGLMLQATSAFPFRP